MSRRSWRDTTTPMHDADRGDRRREQNRADVFDFPHQYGRQHTNGGKRRHDETPELEPRDDRTRLEVLQLSARTQLILEILMAWRNS